MPERGNSAKDARDARLARALRENLKKRKAQARTKAAGSEDLDAAERPQAGRNGAEKRL